MIDLSIVIPTYNSSRTIGQCLDSLAKQTVPRFETIIVDRFSCDGTAKIARDSGATVVQAEANRSQARNIGLKRASSNGVLFVDSDMVLGPDLVEDCLTGLRSYQALVIPELSIGRGFWANCRSLERRTHFGDDIVEAARCFRRKELLSLGGYREDFEAGEDWDLHSRAMTSGISIGRIASTIFHNEGSLTLTAIVRKRYAYGRTFPEYMRSNPWLGVKQVNPVRRILRPSLKVASSHPVHGAGVFVLRTLEFAAAVLGSIIPDKH